MELKPRREPDAGAASHIAPELVEWLLSPRAARDLSDLRAEIGPTSYLAERDKLRQHLCAYFNSSRCAGHSTSIFSLGATASGGKRFKVRWMLPGRGKRRGCRMAVMAWCTERRVKIFAVWDKKEEPSETDFSTAFAAE